MSSCMGSGAEASSISWKQLCLSKASEQFYACWWYKSNFSPSLVVRLLINSCSKNPRSNLCFHIRLISLQGPSQSRLHSAATLLRPSIPGQNTPHLPHESTEQGSISCSKQGGSWEESLAVKTQSILQQWAGCSEKCSPGQKYYQENATSCTWTWSHGIRQGHFWWNPHRDKFQVTQIVS